MGAHIQYVGHATVFVDLDGVRLLTDPLLRNRVAHLRRASGAGTLKVKHPRQAADLFLSMFLGDGHIRGLLMLDMPDARENKALLREAVRVFMTAYAPAHRSGSAGRHYP